MKKLALTCVIGAVALATSSAALGGHHMLSVFNDPLLVQIDPSTERPYEWQFAAANVGPALDISSGSASVVVGTIDSGAADISDLAGKVDSRWTVSAKGKVSRDSSGNDYLGHGSAVASLIAANGFG